MVGALSRPGRDPALPELRRRPVRPEARHPLQHPRRRPRTTTRQPTAGGCAPSRARPYVVKFLITAVGLPVHRQRAGYSRACSDFAGDWYHTGQWPHEGVDFTGKRVGLIGTGSTGIQAAPVIAAHGQASDRVPAHRELLGAGAQRAADARSSGATSKSTPSEIRAHDACRPSTAWRFKIEDRAAVETPPEERETIYEAAWERGGLQFRAAFRGHAGRQGGERHGGGFHQAQDPLDREGSRPPRPILSDIDHPYAAKRPPIDTDYFETFNRANVTLVDCGPTPIERIIAAGICTTEAEYPVDIIVFATGFDAMTGPLLRMDIRGRDGVALEDVWEAGPRNYLGLQVAGLPQPVHHHRPRQPVGAVQHAGRDRAARRLDHRLHRAHARRAGSNASRRGPRRWTNGSPRSTRSANATVLPLAKHSWYLGANIPGKPRVFMPYAGGMLRYRQICADVAARGYEGFMLS